MERDCCELEGTTDCLQRNALPVRPEEPKFKQVQERQRNGRPRSVNLDQRIILACCSLVLARMAERPPPYGRNRDADEAGRLRDRVPRLARALSDSRMQVHAASIGRGPTDSSPFRATSGQRPGRAGTVLRPYHGPREARQVMPQNRGFCRGFARSTGRPAGPAPGFEDLLGHRAHAAPPRRVALDDVVEGVLDPDAVVVLAVGEVLREDDVAGVTQPPTSRRTPSRD